MGIQRYSIIYSSKTGNTKKLAEKIREVLPEENCDYFGTEGAKALSSWQSDVPLKEGFSQTVYVQ